MDNATTNNMFIDHILRDLKSEGIFYDNWHYWSAWKTNIKNLAISILLLEKHPGIEI